MHQSVCKDTKFLSEIQIFGQKSFSYLFLRPDGSKRQSRAICSCVPMVASGKAERSVISFQAGGVFGGMYGYLLVTSLRTTQPASNALYIGICGGFGGEYQ